MNKRITKNIFLLITLAIICLVMSMTASAEELVEGDYTYTVENGVATITAYYGEGGEIVIPLELGGYTVTGIGDEAFRGSEGLTSIEIPDSVTSIGYASFFDCNNLKDIDMPESVTYIGNYAFSGTNIRSFKIPHGITDLRGGMFYECCNLLTVEIPNGVIDLGWATFELCESLEYIYIPSSVTTIDDYAFLDCTSLKAVFYEGNEEDWNRINIGKENESLTEAILNFNTSFYKNIDKEIIELDVSLPIVNQKMYEYLFLYYDMNDYEESEKTIIGDLVVKSDFPYKSLGTLATNLWDILKKMGGSDEYKTILNIAERIVINEWTAVPSELFVNDCLLEQIYLNESVRKINNNSFTCCNNLKIIYVANKNCSIKNAGLNSDAIVYCSESSIAYSEAKEAGYNVVAHEAHDVSWEVVNKGSCGVVGIKKGVCSICGYIEYEEGYQHTEETLPAVSATCTSTGLTDGIKCLACGEILVEQTTTEILPHSMGEWETILEPTCTESGEEKRKCANCDYYETNILDANGHTEETLPAVSATCTSTGLTDGIKCLACGEILVEQTITEMLPHSMEEWVTIQEPTCTEQGEEKRKCANCDYYEMNTLNATGHTDSTWITDSNPTCKKQGSKHIECTVCEEVLKTESIPVIPHSYSAVVTAPTCISGGYTTYTCACGDMYIADETPATEHNYKNGVCTECGDSKVDSCSCNCHKSGFMGFIWKLICFFYKIFGTNKICDCGVAHY